MYSQGNASDSILISVVSLSLIHYLLIANVKKYAEILQLVGYNNNFWCRQELKMWISGALFEQYFLLTI